MADSSGSLEYAIIELVKAKPILYDPDRFGNNNRLVRKMLWTKILDKLNSLGFNVKDINHLEQKWELLKAHFLKLCKSIPKERPIASAPVHLIKIDWPFFGSFLFLKDHIPHMRNVHIKFAYRQGPVISTPGGIPCIPLVPLSDNTSFGSKVYAITRDRQSNHPETPQKNVESPERCGELEKEQPSIITDAPTAVAKIKDHGNCIQDHESRTFSDFVASALQNMDAEQKNSTMEAISEIIFFAKRQAQPIKS